MSYTISYFYRFGDFALDLEQRVLLRADRPVPLTPKVFDTLLVLVEHHGRIVGKEELMGRLWPNSFVEDSNLIFNVQQLRKALGDNARNPVYVETVPRRGYRFIAEVQECPAETEPNAAFVTVHPSSDSSDRRHETKAAEAGTNLPRLARRLIAAAVVVIAVASLSAWYVARSIGNHNKTRNSVTAGSASLAALNVERLTLTGNNRHAVISPDGKYVAYTFEVKGKHGIWLRELATDTGKEIVSLSDRLGGLAFAHSGQYLYFVRGPADSWALYRVGLPLGGIPVKLIDKPQGSYSISPDDRQIAFVRYSEDDKQCALMIAGTDGQHERVLSVHSQPDRFNTPAWSTDGKTVTVAVGPSDSGTEQVRMVEFNAADGSAKEVAAGKWFHISRIVSLPQQSGLLIVGSRSFKETKHLWQFSYASGELRQLTNGPAPYADVSITADGRRAVAPQATFSSDVWVGPADTAHNPKRITHATEDICWTPDGRLIYSSHASSNLNLWIMRPDGTEQKQLTNEGEWNATPAVTADGRFIVFASSRSGRLQIWRMEIDGSNPTQLTNGTANNLPDVSPDGRSVFYNSVDDWSLWRVSINGGEPIRLTDSAAIHPSVSPDGKLVACVGKGNEKRRTVVIVSASDGKLVQELDIRSLKLSSYRLKWSADGGSLLFAASRAGVASIYKQSLGGGAPQKTVEFDEDDIFDFGYSAGDQQLAVTRGDYRFDIVLLSGLNP